MPAMPGFKSHFLPILLLIIATIAVYATSLGHEFTNWDDPAYVLNNETIRGFSLEHLHQAFTKYFVGNYAPLHLVSYMLDYSLWGLRPAGFIATNIFFHLLNGVLYYVLVFKLTKRREWAFSAAFIFLLHPVQVESVAWISQRKNVLAMLFFLIALLFYIVYRERTRLKSLFWYSGSIVVFICALLTKSVTVVFPLVLLLYDFNFICPKERKNWLLNKVPFLIVSLVIGIVALKSQAVGIGGGIRPGYYGGTLLNTFYTMLPVWLRYLGMLFWPTNLSPYYDQPIKNGIDGSVILAGLLLLSIIIGIFVICLRHRRLFFWGALFVVGLLPVCQIVPLVTLFNDRYLYFPMLGAAAFIAMAFSEAADRLPFYWKRAAIFIFALFLIVLPALSFVRVKAWSNSLTLWTDAYNKNPRSETVLYSLGATYHKAGNLALARYYYEKTLEVGPSKDGLINLRALYLAVGEYERAKWCGEVLNRQSALPKK
jgi:hypothetical protein